MKKPRGANVVERAIAWADGSPMELGRRLSLVVGFEVTKQRVHGWRMREKFPPEFIMPVHRLTAIPMEDLLSAKPRPLYDDNIVNKAIALSPAGKDGAQDAARFAAALSKLSGQRVTRQMVNGWQLVGRIPVEFVPWAHMLTRIPVSEMMRAHERKAKA